jgi:glutathione S-transferase
VSAPLLWHFPISHYNEKVRWALDWKRVPHRRVALSASYLPRAWWATGRAALPVLHLDGRAIGDSTAILAALEQRHPDPPLYPRDAALRARALALEDWFDEEIGPSVRTFVVSAVMEQQGGARTAEVLLTEAHPAVRRLFAALHPLFRRFYYRRHGMDAAARDAAGRIVRSGFERVARELGAADYLAGGAFSVADLTAAAILAPLVRPAGTLWARLGDYPDAIETAILELRGMSGFRWVEEMYRRHRGASAQVGSPRGGIQR